MDINSFLKTISDSHYDICLITHKDKSDEELREIITTNQRLVMAMPLNADITQLADGEKRVAEIKVCNKILEDRAADKKRNEIKQANVRQAKIDWEKDLTNRRKKAILNFPYAVTYEGQLVVSILEDEGPKNYDEIAEWDETFSKMERGELNKLLKALVDEGILEYNNGDYSVLNVCTDSLFPLNPSEWARKIFRQKGKSMDHRQPRIISAIQEKNEPITEDEIKELVYYYDESLKQLLDFKILEKHKIAKEKMHMYYFTMLGENKGGNNK